MEENKNLLTESQYQIVLRLLDKNMISIRGSDVFPVTYGFLANVSVTNSLNDVYTYWDLKTSDFNVLFCYFFQMAVVIVTFFIICVQS